MRRDGAPRGGETETMDFLRKHLPTSAGRYVERYLKGIEFPIRKEELVGRLEANGVPGAVVSEVRELAPRRRVPGTQGRARRPAASLEATHHTTRTVIRHYMPASGSYRRRYILRALGRSE